MKRIALIAVAASSLLAGCLSGVPASAKSTALAHQTLKTIAQSVAQAKARDAKAKTTAPLSIAADVALAQAAAVSTVAKANTTVLAAAARGDTADEWANIATLYQATATLSAVNQVAADLAPPLPPPPTTTTTAPPATTTTLAPTTTTTVPPGRAPPVGVYNGSVTSALSLAKTLGLSPLTGYSFYCDGDTWQSIASCSPATGLPAGTVQLVGLNLSPGGAGDSAALSSLATFESVAHNFIGTPVIFRLGWEFDGNWFPWGNGVNGNTPASFAAATAQVIPAMKAVDPSAQFDFSDNTGTSTLAQLKAFMGNNAALWTYVGGDHYDNLNSTTGGTMSAMTATVTLASQLNKPLSLGEWGLHGSDDVKFISAMCQVIKSPAVASAANNWPSYTVGPTSYFSADLQINSAIGQFPNSVAAYKADCG